MTPEQIVAKFVALADSDPFMCIGHIVEHVIPEARNPLEASAVQGFPTLEQFKTHVFNRWETWQASEGKTIMAISPADAMTWIERAYCAGYDVGDASARYSLSQESGRNGDQASPEVPAPTPRGSLPNSLGAEYEPDQEWMNASLGAPPEPRAGYWSYLDKYATEHVEEVSEFLAELMCDYADRDQEAKAAMVGTAVDFLSQWVMRQPPTKAGT